MPIINKDGKIAVILGEGDIAIAHRFGGTDETRGVSDLSFGETVVGEPGKPVPPEYAPKDWPVTILFNGGESLLRFYDTIVTFINEYALELETREVTASQAKPSSPS